MAGLPEGQQDLLVLKQVGELSYREIAELQGEHEGTIKSRLHAAMKAFRQRLEEIGEIG
jgi:RNA polymerase sigma-70 factor (ECF subfamily)